MIAVEAWKAFAAETVGRDVAVAASLGHRGVVEIRVSCSDPSVLPTRSTLTKVSPTGTILTTFDGRYELFDIEYDEDDQREVVMEHLLLAEVWVLGGGEERTRRVWWGRRRHHLLIEGGETMALIYARR